MTKISKPLADGLAFMADAHATLAQTPEDTEGALALLAMARKRISLAFVKAGGTVEEYHEACRSHREERRDAIGREIELRREGAAGSA